MKVKFTHTSYRQPLQKARHNIKKTLKDGPAQTKELLMSGSKGGRVERQRQQAKEIDLELRDYIYR